MNSKAFTLVELAIVITIIGLLIGGVLKGQELLENARMTSLANQTKAYTAAITTFKDLYKGFPGDTTNATNFITGCTAANNCINGDGNGQIASVPAYLDHFYAGFDTDEAFQSWKHLALANLITGVDTSVARPATYVAGRHVPASPIKGMFYLKHSIEASGAFNGLVLFMTTGTAGTWVGGNLPVTTAQKVDLKMDDGIAMMGDTWAVSSGFNTGCGHFGTTGYDPNAAGTPCELGFRLMN